MASRTITGTFTFSSTSNASSGMSRMTNALAQYNYVNRRSELFEAGITRSGSVVTVSIEFDERDTAFTAASEMMVAIVSGSRHTAGGWSVNKI